MNSTRNYNIGTWDSTSLADAYRKFRHCVQGTIKRSCSKLTSKEKNALPDENLWFKNHYKFVLYSHLKTNIYYATRLLIPSVLNIWEEINGTKLEPYGNPNHFWFYGELHSRRMQIQINILDITIYDQQQSKSVQYVLNALSSCCESYDKNKMTEEHEVPNTETYNTMKQKSLIPQDDAIKKAFSVLFAEIKPKSLKVDLGGKIKSTPPSSNSHVGIADKDRSKTTDPLQKRFDYRMQKSKWMLEARQLDEKVKKIGHDRAMGILHVCTQNYVFELKTRISEKAAAECNLLILEQYFRREYNAILFTYSTQKYKEVRSNLEYHLKLIHQALKYKYNDEEPMHDEEDYEYYLIKHHESMELNICPNKKCKVPLILHAPTDPELWVCGLCCELNTKINDKKTHYKKFGGIQMGDEQGGRRFAQILQLLNLRFTDDLRFPEGVRFTGTVYNATHLTGKDLCTYNELKKCTRMGIYPGLKIKDFGGEKRYGVVATRNISMMTMIAEYAGEVMSIEQVTKIYELDHYNSIFHLITTLDHKTSLEIVPYQYSNIGRFFNSVETGGKYSQHQQNIKSYTIRYTRRNSCFVLYH